MAENDLRFSHCVERIFRGWTALQLAVSNGFGGCYSEDKEQWFISATVQWFHQNSDLDPTEVEEFLAEVMNSEYDTLLEDGSDKQIASMLCRFNDLLKQNKQAEALNLYNMLKEPSDTSQCQRAAGDDSENEENEDMDIADQAYDSHDDESNQVYDNTEEAEHIASGRNRYVTDDDGWTTKGSRAKPK